MAKRRINVGFVELQPTFPNIGSVLICPTYGVIVLATILRDLGYSTSIMVEGMAKFSIEDLEDFDFTCFSVKSASANKTYKMADKLRHRGKKVIFGGTHATFFPEDCLDHCDYVIRGEGDSVLPALLDCLENNIDPASLKGLSYIKGKQAHDTEDITPPTNLSTHSDYSLVNNIDHLGPVARLIRGRHMMLPVQSSRGCPHQCSFCMVNKMFGSTYRKRPIEAVIREIKSALRYTNNIHFVDNDFVGSSDLDVEHTAALLEAIIENNLKIKASVFMTIDVAKNEDLLKLMRRSGIQTLMIGFESVDQKSLACYHKNQEISEMEDNAKVLKDYGFTILGSFMAGSSGEDDQTIIQTAHLSSRWGIDQLYYFVLSPYPEMTEIVSPQHVFLNNWDYAT
ncbi:MAG: B12-binding domain-containing radical SAM protein, partial [Planctomycetota bacterium]